VFFFHLKVFLITSVCAGITGHVRIDAVGDRDADYAILDLDPVTGKFEVSVSTPYSIKTKTINISK
jgi:hypothetical protein